MEKVNLTEVLIALGTLGISLLFKRKKKPKCKPPKQKPSQKPKN